MSTEFDDIKAERRAAKAPNQIILKGARDAAKYFPGPYHVSAGCIISRDGHKLADIRGWGRLTGEGMPDHLEPKEAAATQDAISVWICHMLTQPLPS